MGISEIVTNLLPDVVVNNWTGSLAHMSYSLNSLKGVTYGIIYGTIIGVTKGDTRSLDYSSYDLGPARDEDYRFRLGR